MNDKKKTFYIFGAIFLLLLVAGSVHTVSAAQQQQLRTATVNRVTLSQRNNNNTIPTNTRRKPAVKIMPKLAAERAIELAKLHYVDGVLLKEIGIGKPIYEVNGSKRINISKHNPRNLSIKLEVNAENGTLDRIFNENKWIKLRYNSNKENFSEEIQNRILNRVTTMKISRLRKETALRIKVNDTDFSSALSHINRNINWNAEIKPMNNDFKRMFSFILANADDAEKEKMHNQLNNYASALQKNKTMRANIHKRLENNKNKLNDIRRQLQNNTPTEDILNSISG